MRPAGPALDAASVWDIATPARGGLPPGIAMAGFRARTTDPVDLRIVPYPAVTLAVDLGDDPIVVDDASGHPRRGSLVLGLSASGVRGHGRNFGCLQIRLSPLVARGLLDGGTGPDVVSLDDVWGRDAVRLQERLRAVADWDERFALVRAALVRRLDRARPVEPEVAFAWGRMVRQRGAVEVERLAVEAGWSRKRLWSRFRARTGLGPKHAARLVRFDHAAHRLAAGDSAARVAAECGYADQSHLHRDVVAFTGTTPTAVALAPWLAVDDVAWAAPAYLSPPPGG
ncbi:helix-turn-helix domain-containing protein [Streptomyces sp. S6]